MGTKLCELCSTILDINSKTDHEVYCTHPFGKCDNCEGEIEINRGKYYVGDVVLELRNILLFHNQTEDFK